MPVQPRPWAAGRDVAAHVLSFVPAPTASRSRRRAVFALFRWAGWIDTLHLDRIELDVVEQSQPRWLAFLGREHDVRAHDADIDLGNPHATSVHEDQDHGRDQVHQAGQFRRQGNLLRLRQRVLQAVHEDHEREEDDDQDARPVPYRRTHRRA